MSLQLCCVHSYDSQNVILYDWETNESKKSVWQQLVLVKAPVIPGPEQINQFIKKEEKYGVLKTRTRRSSHTLANYTCNGCRCRSRGKATPPWKCSNPEIPKTEVGSISIP
jgi:hypothetical protein